MRPTIYGFGYFGMQMSPVGVQAKTGVVVGTAGRGDGAAFGSVVEPQAASTTHRETTSVFITALGKRGAY